MNSTTVFILVLIFLIAFTINSRSGHRKPKVYKDINVREFNDKKEMKHVTILDVRTRQEIEQGKIPGTLEADIKVADFTKKLSYFDKSKTYLVYCRSGRRSARACIIMHSLGFKNLYNLKGGFIAWSKTARK